MFGPLRGGSRVLENSIWLFKEAFEASTVFFLSGDVVRARATQPWVVSCISLQIHLSLKY